MAKKRPTPRRGSHALETIDAEEMLRRSREHPLDVIEAVARRELEELGFEPPASFIDTTSPETRAKLKKKLDRAIRSRRRPGKRDPLSVPTSEEGRRRTALHELARERETTPKVLAAQALVSVLFARRQLAQVEALADGLGAQAASQLRSSVEDIAYHAFYAGFVWKSARHRPLQRDDRRGRDTHPRRSP